MKIFPQILLLFAAINASAEQRWITLNSSAGNGDIPVYIDERADAIATVVLVPGGPFSVGKKDPVTGKPDGINFLVRTVDMFAAEKLNVVLMDKPSRGGDLRESRRRASNDHAQDILQVAEKAKELKKPVWLVGTSLGGISVGNAAQHDEKGIISGIVFSSSVYPEKKYGVLSLNLSDMKIPVLISGHEKDECPSTAPSLIPDLKKKLTSARVVEVSLIKNGSSPKGNVCGPWHWHGYINAEQEAVKSISGFISKNTM
jgi:hypothetical protein